MEQYHPPQDPRNVPKEQLAWARRSYETAPQPKGIGGWLVLPMLALFATAMRGLITLRQDIFPLLQDWVDGYLPPPGAHYMWAPLWILETVIVVAVLIASVALLILMFKKSRVFPKAMIWFYALSAAVVVLIDLIILGFADGLLPDAAVRQEVGFSASVLFADMVTSVLPAAIWIPYFLLSERVKNTFLNPPITEWVRPGGRWDDHADHLDAADDWNNRDDDWADRGY
jgi:hypothetical protein